MPLWILCEIAIVACDLAEVLGAAIGLKLLFGLPLLLGRAHHRARRAAAARAVAPRHAPARGHHPDAGRHHRRLLRDRDALSQPDLGRDPARTSSRATPTAASSLFARLPGGGWSVLGLHGDSLYIAMGILGATVMPHNLYLHSALVQSRAVGAVGRGASAQAARINLVDSVVALNAALLRERRDPGAGGGGLPRAAATRTSRSLEDAHRLLAPLLGTALASTLFAVALLSSGQSSTITGTLAGQIVMEGFLRLPHPALAAPADQPRAGHRARRCW